MPDIDLPDLPDEAELPVIDSMVSVEISDDEISAYMLLTEASGGGASLSLEEILEAISDTGVCYGLIESTVRSIVVNKAYNKKICIARGTAPVHGEDGTITYHFTPSDELMPAVNEIGETDYKDMGLVRNIYIGTLIAEITQPVPGRDGVSVRGEVIKHVPGKEIKYTPGAGTVMSEDGSEVYAALDGNLNWQKDRFVVDETLVIKGGVHPGTGNIDFMGDVIVKGEVMENFTVKSGKSINVQGTVTQANLIAEGDITILLGAINSDIEAKGSVKANFFQNTKIHCEGDLSAQSFVVCDVYCGGEFSATSGKGAVVGGRYVALGGFAANIIGSENFIKMRVTLGDSAVLAEEKLELEHGVYEAEENCRKLVQVIDLLQEHKRKIGALSPDRESMLAVAIRSRFTYQRQTKQMQARIAEIDASLREVMVHSITVKREIWPGVTVRVGVASALIEKHTTKTLIKEGEDGTLEFAPLTGGKKTT